MSQCAPPRSARLLLTLLLATAATFLAALGAGPAPAAAMEIVRVGGAFNQPIYVTAPERSPRRLFVVERGGTIRVVVDGQTQTEPFLRIPGGVSTEGEGGLLSMAFPPNYPDDRRFYVFYSTPRTTAGGGDIAVTEFKRSVDDPNVAVANSQRRVLTIEHTARENHYAGQLQFGPDGLLYISTGDGGGANDPEGDAQSTSSLLGKILRIDPRGAEPGEYGIPPSNPLVGRPGEDEIYTTGLRNPFRFSFDRTRGHLWIGDVGQDLAEEVDFLPRGAPGANFGWNCFEGTQRTPAVTPPCDPRFHIRPIHEYLHTQHDAPCHAITGGYVVRDPNLPELFGEYVYGDYCGGEIWALGRGADGSLRNRRISTAPPFQLVSFGEDASGRLHVVLTPGGDGPGSVYRIQG